jgi:ABC-type transporter Mla subunit MlaD
MRNPVATLLQEFQNVQQGALEAGRKREQETNERTQATVSGLAGSVEALVQQIAHASSKMEESVSALGKTTTSAISQLSDGADQVNAASRNFTAASEKVTGAMNQASTVTTKLTDLTTALTVASSSLQQGVQDYKTHRDSVGKLISDLNGLVANAKTDVSITSDVLRRIEAAAQELGKAQGQTEQFMTGVATVLAKAHESFREAMLKTVRENNHEFQSKLSSAVALLGTSIKELDDVLSTATPRGSSK